MQVPEDISKELEILSSEMEKNPLEILKGAWNEFRFRKSLSLALKSAMQKMYYDGEVSKKELLLFLTKEDAGEVILADETGKEGVKIAEGIWDEIFGN